MNILVFKGRSFILPSLAKTLIFGLCCTGNLRAVYGLVQSVQWVFSVTVLAMVCVCTADPKMRWFWIYYLNNISLTFHLFKSQTNWIHLKRKLPCYKSTKIYINVRRGINTMHKWRHILLLYVCTKACSNGCSGSTAVNTVTVPSMSDSIITTPLYVFTLAHRVDKLQQWYMRNEILILFWILPW